MNMSSKHRKKKQPSMPALNEQPAGAEAAAADTKPVDTESGNAGEQPGSPEPSGENKTAADAEKKGGAKIVVPARIKVKTDRDGNLIETEPAGEPVQKPAPGGRRAEPVRTVTPADIKKPQVSFMNSIANVEAEAAAQRAAASTSQAYDHAVLVSDAEESNSYRPKIRRMSDSTRAKELRHRQSSDSQPYQKVTPVATPQTLPASKLRKRKDQQVSPEVLERIPDNLKRHPLVSASPVHVPRVSPVSDVPPP